MEDYSPSFWLSLLQLAGNVALGVYVWYVNRQKATRAEFKAIEDRIVTMKDNQHQACTHHITRTTTLETQIKEGPSRAEIGQLHDRVTAVKGAVDNMSGMMKGMRDNVNLLVDFHLRGPK